MPAICPQARRFSQAMHWNAVERLPTLSSTPVITGPHISRMFPVHNDHISQAFSNDHIILWLEMEWSAVLCCCLI
ncbi:hypothetical protein BDR04DRAFT_322804 [Suillus decipiens]|nr:hypothetical protein BDR04DRAFT_322804 [Suillus decipiens]